MNFASGCTGQETEIAGHFGAVFAASEGADEGARIGRLARALMAETEAGDRIVVVARETGALVGCIIFSRLRFSQDRRTVFLMAPVAVATARQGRGIGQRLIAYGLDLLRGGGADVAVTYGDPGYYSRTGFLPVSTDRVPPPFPLSQPHGWLARSLTGRQLGSIAGEPTCVKALQDPAYW